MNQARVNKCLIALVNRKIVRKDNSTVRPMRIYVVSYSFAIGVGNCNVSLEWTAELITMAQDACLTACNNLYVRNRPRHRLNIEDGYLTFTSLCRTATRRCQPPYCHLHSFSIAQDSRLDAC